MKTKTLILTALMGLAGGAVMADVYSQNVVGYINLTVPGNKFAMISSQLSNTAGGNGINAALTNGVPDGSVIYFYTASGFQAIQYYADPGGWYDSELNLATNTLGGGNGAFFLNGSSSPCTLTIVGEVPQGTNNVTIKNGFQLLSLVPPISSSIDAVATKLPATDADVYFHWNGNGYDAPIQYYADPGGWYDAELNERHPAPAVGESFFYLRNGAQANWQYSFSVN